MQGQPSNTMNVCVRESVCVVVVRVVRLGLIQGETQNHESWRQKEKNTRAFLILTLSNCFPFKLMFLDSCLAHSLHLNGSFPFIMHSLLSSQLIANNMKSISL